MFARSVRVFWPSVFSPYGRHSSFAHNGLINISWKPDWWSIFKSRTSFNSTTNIYAILLFYFTNNIKYNLMTSIYWEWVFAGLTESLDPYIDCIPAKMKTEYLDDCFQAMKAIGLIREGNNKSVTRTLKMLTCVFKRPKLCKINVRV